jgi:hypothetical protein
LVSAKSELKLFPRRYKVGSSVCVYVKGLSFHFTSAFQLFFLNINNKTIFASYSLIKNRFSDRSIAGMGAPGPDGFLGSFYHKAWSVVGACVEDAVLELFGSGQLLKEVNSTIITLVPKKRNPSSMGEYRPISCCNVIYKCITKVLANKLLPGLVEVVSPNQWAFIPGRSIGGNILLAPLWSMSIIEIRGLLDVL